MKTWLLLISLAVGALAAPAIGATVEVGNLDNTPYVQIFAGSVTAAVPQMTYRFVLRSTCNFTLNVNQLSAAADAYLFDAAGRQLAASTNPMLTPENIQTLLSAGTYSVVVQKKSTVTASFQVELSAVFSISEFIVSGDLDMPDPEYDYIGNNVAWRSDFGELFVAKVDPATGIFNLANKQLVIPGWRFRTWS